MPSELTQGLQLYIDTSCEAIYNFHNKNHINTIKRTEITCITYLFLGKEGDSHGSNL